MEAKAHLGQAGFNHRVAQAALVFGIEHEKAAAAGSDQLSAQGAAFHCALIALVDLGVRHVGRAALLVLPMLVQQLAKLTRASRLQRLQAAQPEVLYVVQILDHAGILPPCLGILLAEDHGRATRITGEKQDEAVFKVMKRFGRGVQRPRLHAVIAIELKTGHAAERRNILILLADRLGKTVDLDVARPLGKLFWVDELPAVGIERFEQRGGETAGGSQPGPCRNVGHGRDLERTPIQTNHLERFSYDRMLQLVDGLDPFEGRILDDKLVDEGLMHGDVDILVDRRRDEESGFMTVVGRKISAAATERDA